MKQKIKWGILGPGRIARAFAEGLRHTPEAELTAIGSRSLERAREFSHEWEVPQVFGSYEELASSSSVDAVYVAIPHSEHHDAVVLCLRNKKSVLCEKPLGVNAKQVGSMIQTAREEGVLLMEGMWSRFPPMMEKVRELALSGSLGEIRLLQADFGFLPKDKNPAGRLYNPNLAGGSVLDLGIYPLSFASMIMGSPTDFATLATMGETGVDEQASCILKYANGAHALLNSSLQCQSAQEAFLAGTKASLRIHKQCWKPQKISIHWHESDQLEEMSMPFAGNGFNYEARHFGELINLGKKESDIMPLSESLSICETMDGLRKAWAMKYPFED